MHNIIWAKNWTLVYKITKMKCLDTFIVSLT